MSMSYRETLLKLSFRSHLMYECLYTFKSLKLSSNVYGNNHMNEKIKLGLLLIQTGTIQSTESLETLPIGFHSPSSNN